MNTPKRSDKTYNGWTNYETWNVKLWIDNDEGSQRFWQEQADDAIERQEGDTDDAVSELAHTLESETKAQAPDLGATCWADLLNAALSDVNWYEIAQSLVNDAKERMAA